MQTRSKGPARTKKEAFFVQVPTSDSSVAFFNVTEHLGKTMPFEKPKATCAMRATPDSISFSLLHLTKRSASNIATAPIEMPRGPIAKLERKAAQYQDMEDNEVVVEHGQGEEGKVNVHRLKMHRDENGIAVLEMMDSPEGDVADVEFELPKGAVSLAIYLKSPAVKRVIGVGFIGHLGKPGDASTLTRAVSMALFSLTQLTEFKILSGIETVNVPAPPNRWAGKKPVRRAEDKAVAAVPVRLFSGDPQPQPLGEGDVVVEVDLENANPNSGRLLFHYTPGKEVEAVFPDFRHIFDSTISSLVTAQMGVDEVAEITFEIILGAVESGTVERLRDALKSIKGLDFTPTQYRQH